MIFFTSDLHLGDDRLIEATRPWCSVATHTKVVIEQINRVTTKHDRLIILGDMGDIKQWRSARNKLHCKNIQVIKGNHDHIPKLAEVFGKKCVFESRCVKLFNGKVCYCTHFPHAFWEKSHYQSYHLYGHCHGKRESELDRCWPDRLSMDVGIDNILALTGSISPVSEVWIAERFSSRSGHEHV